MMSEWREALEALPTRKANGAWFGGYGGGEPFPGHDRDEWVEVVEKAAVMAALAATPVDERTEPFIEFGDGERISASVAIERLRRPFGPICGAVSESGPNREPLACAYPPNPPDERMHEHSWATLPTFVDGAATPAEIDGVYAERNRLVAALAHLFSNAAWRGLDPDAPDFTVVYIDLPSGQVSWHIPDAEMTQFPPLPLREPTGWDGHDTAEKYRRVAALRRGDICRDVNDAVERALAATPAEIDVERLVRALAKLPPGPYWVNWPDHQGGTAHLWGRQGTPPDFADGWAIPLVAAGVPDVIEGVAMILNDLAAYRDIPVPAQRDRAT